MSDNAEPATGEEAPSEAITDSAETPAATVEQLAAEVEKWQKLSRKNEDRAKANAKAQQELEALKLQSMSDQERAVETARSEARNEALREFGETRVGDAFRVAAAGKAIDVDDVLDGINLARFLADDGQPDTEAITTWVDKIAPPADTTGRVPDLGQGARAGGSHTPLNGDPLEQALKRAVGA